MLLRLALLGFALLAATPAAAAEPPRPAPARVAIVPFESVLGVRAARSAVTGQIALALAGKGLDVASGVPVEDFLRRERVRYFDSLPRATAHRLAEAMRADAVVVGSILAFEPREGARDPLLALTAQLVSPSGEVLWGKVAALSGAEMENGLGLGRITRLEGLLPVAVDRLLEDFPVQPRLVRVSRSAGPFGLPRVYRARNLGDAPLKIFMLPLEPLAGGAGAARTVEAELRVRLAERKDLELVPPGDVRAAALAAGLPAPAQMSTRALMRLAEAVGARYYLSGAILTWGSGATLKGLPGPEVEVYLQLTDVQAGRAVWSGTHFRNGTEYEGWLKLGAIANLPALADRVGCELLQAFMR